MECVILYRTHSGHVDFVRGDDPLDIYIYPNEDEAIKDTQTRKLFKAVPFQVVRLDEL